MNKKLLAVLTAALLTAVPLTGCDITETSTESVAMADLPYGSTIAEDASRDITISYDKRFIDEQLVEKIYTFYHSLQEQDAEAFTSVMFPLFHDYQLSEQFEGKVTDADIVAESHTSIEEYCGYDFVYTLVEVTDLIQKGGDVSAVDDFLGLLDGIAEKQGKPFVSEKTQEMYELYLTPYLAERGSGATGMTELSLPDVYLYAIQYDGEWYLMYES